MTEETTTQTTETTETQTNTPPASDNKPEQDTSTLSMVEEANKAADRLEAANKAQIALIERQEKLFAQQRLGGRSMAGGTMKEPEDPLKDPVAYSKALMKGEVNPLDTKKN